MTDKVLIAKCESKGNLQNYLQSYYMYYYLKVFDGDKVALCDKAIIEFVAPSSNGEPATKGYFMVDPANTRVMLIDMLKLYFYFQKRRDNLNEFNMHYLVSDIQKKVLETAKDVLRGNE